MQYILLPLPTSAAAADAAAAAVAAAAATRGDCKNVLPSDGCP